VARRVILVVLFDTRTTVGMVRLEMRKTVTELARLFEEMFSRPQTSTSGLLAGAEDEIDKLFE
jgi:hypothetical protein